MNTQQFLQSKIINKYFSLRFFVLSVFLTVVIFAILAFDLKNYVATETILIIPKSQVAVAQQEKIIANMVELPHTLAFYDRMLLFNPDLKDFTVGKTSEERKRLWNSILKTRQIRRNTSMVQVSVSATSTADASMLDSKTTRTLLNTMSFYYDIKKDIDLRIVDGPIVTENLPMWPVLLLLSCLLAILIAFCVEYFLRNQIKTVAEFDEQQKSKNYFSFQKKETQPKEQERPQSDEMEVLNKFIEQETYPNYPEMPVHAQQKASAPDNLPIAEAFDQADMFGNQAEQEEQKSKNHEPTTDEFKKRLNQLLKGEL